jgi:hypothetical protein
MPKRSAKHRAPAWKRKRVAHLPGYTSETGTAHALGVAVRTLRKWRQLGLGPPYVRVSRQVHYQDHSLQAWVQSREIMPVRSELAARVGTP